MSAMSVVHDSAATDRTVANGVIRPTKLSIVRTVMNAARGWWCSKVPAQLAAIIGCDVRSAERYLSGDRTMNASAVFALLRSPVGVKMVEAATAGMPPQDYETFWMEMAKAAARADLRCRQDSSGS